MACYFFAPNYVFLSLCYLETEFFLANQNGESSFRLKPPNPLPSRVKNDCIFFSSSLPISRSTILVKLKTNNTDELQYKPGDHVAIFPANHPVLVQSLVDKLSGDVDPDTLIVIETLREIKGNEIMYLLTEWEGRTGKHLARGHGVRIERQRGPCAMTEGQIFSCPARPKLSKQAFYHMGSLHYLRALRR